MIKINRTTEYGLMALRHMTRKRLTDVSGVTSAREVADVYGLPFEITAKTLQRLKDTGLIQSAQGAKGGYTLQRDLDAITLAEFLDLMEGRQSVVACSPQQAGVEDDPHQCTYQPRCEIRSLMSNLSHRVYHFLSGIRLSELTDSTEALPFAALSQVTKTSQLAGKERS